jgi:hypothetical protein
MLGAGTLTACALDGRAVDVLLEMQQPDHVFWRLDAHPHLVAVVSPGQRDPMYARTHFAAQDRADFCDRLSIHTAPFRG